MVLKAVGDFIVVETLPEKEEEGKLRVVGREPSCKRGAIISSGTSDFDDGQIIIYEADAAKPIALGYKFEYIMVKNIIAVESE